MLSIKERQTYLKHLGFYFGNIDGIVGPKTKTAYKSLQKTFFIREKDIDGIYGKNTDILLQNAYNVSVYCKNFTLKEFRCGCGGKHCTGYPEVLNIDLLKNLQTIRDRYGATTVTSALRCAKHNTLVGGVSGSRHKNGKAVDIKNSTSKTELGRTAIMNLFKTLPKARYTYCNIKGSNPNMGTAVHIDVI